MTIFFAVTWESNAGKAEALKRAIERHNENLPTEGRSRFEVTLALLSVVPGSPLAYWASDAIRCLFVSCRPFECDSRTAKVGVQTSDDVRFVRTWWEVEQERPVTRWFSFTKGGASSAYYADLSTVLTWGEGGAEIKAFAERTPGTTHWSRNIRSTDWYFTRGFSWALRTAQFSPHLVPDGCIFSVSRYQAFVPPGSEFAYVALMSSRVCTFLLRLSCERFEHPKFVAGIVQRLPMPSMGAAAMDTLSVLGRRAWSLKRSLATTNETSHTFQLPLTLSERIMCFDRRAVEAELQAIQAQVDDVAFALYGIGAEDRAAIDTSLEWAHVHVGPDAQDDDEELSEAPPFAEGVDAGYSWLVGVAFARFDPRLATGERPIPPEPEPFDPLPARSPGMYQEGDEPAHRPDILIDDEGHSEDLAARVQAVADRVTVDGPENLRGWLAKEFFPLHIKMYSKSRRKAPIYWQLATPSARYSVWLYIHAFSRDTLFRIQNDYVAPKLAHEERRLESLTNELRDGATAAQRKALATQEAVVEELRAFLEEVKRVAPLWKPNLDDGVVINFSPLWRLVPQNKGWQKELKSTWDALCEGKYDWAHLAIHLWPERVVPECAWDRSLAIAHGLEDVFWVEGTDGKWTARKTPTRSVDELVRELTSPAVKSALKSLLEAPAAAGKSGGRRGGGRRKSAAADGGDA